jgi:hypothetical protein
MSSPVALGPGGLATLHDDSPSFPRVHCVARVWPILSLSLSPSSPNVNCLGLRRGGSTPEDRHHAHGVHAAPDGARPRRYPSLTPQGEA